MSDDACFSADVRIQDEWDERAGQVVRYVGVTLRLDFCRWSTPFRVDATYRGRLGQPKQLVRGSAGGDLTGEVAEEMLGELYRQAIDGMEDAEEFHHRCTIYLDVCRTAEVEYPCQWLEDEARENERQSASCPIDGSEPPK